MAERDAARGEIDWASAEVAGGKLTVAIAGEPSKEWAERIEAIIERLQPSGSSWAVKASAEAIEVKGVEPGSESEVRHLLEGAVLQANADFAPDEDEEVDDAGASGEDAAMTEAFRAFADKRGDDGDDA
jgi:hypothetical protein